MITKLTFLVIFLAGCIFTVSNSRILPPVPPASSSLDVNEKYELPGLQETQKQGFVNHIESIEKNDAREKRSPQNLAGLSAGISRILNVTSSLANAFNATTQEFTRLRNLSRRICIDCGNTSSPIITPLPTDYYDDDYYDDYSSLVFGRKKRGVDFQKIPTFFGSMFSLTDNFMKQGVVQLVQNVRSAVNNPIGFIYERVKSVIKNFFDYILSMFGKIRAKRSSFFSNEKDSEEAYPVTCTKNLDTLRRLLKALTTTYFRVIKFGKATFSKTLINETIDFIKTVLIILEDFIQGKEILFAPIDKPYPFQLPDIYEYADYESAETFNKRIDELESAEPKEIVKMQASTDEGLDLMKPTSDKDAGTDIKEADEDEKFDSKIQNLERPKRDTISRAFDLADSLFNFLDKLERKRRSVNNLIPTKTSRKKRFIFDLGIKFIKEVIDGFKQFVLNKMREIFSWTFNYYWENVGGNLLTGFMRYKRSLPSFREPSHVEIARVKREFSEASSIEIRLVKFVHDIIEAINGWLAKSERRKRGVNTFGDPTSLEITRLKRDISDLFSSVQAAVKNVASGIIEVAENGLNKESEIAVPIEEVYSPKTEEEIVNIYRKILSELPSLKQQLSDVALNIEGNNIMSSLDVVHGFLRGTSDAKLRKKREAGDEPPPTSEQLGDFFKLIRDIVAYTFRTIDGTLDELISTVASVLNIASVNANYALAS